MIISASRRTDIPAFYSEWMARRLKEGSVLVRNPWNFRKVRKVSLVPGEVDCIVFWTKDARPMFRYLPDMDALGHAYYFQWTITPYGRDMERNVPPKDEILEGFRGLSRKIGRHRTIWRYDPVIIQGGLSVSWHLEAFSRMCRLLAGYTERCIFSFVDALPGTARRRKENPPEEVGREDMKAIAEGFSHIARAAGISLLTCAEEADFMEDGIPRGACIDGALAERISGHPVRAGKNRKQRPFCGCAASVDIGAYSSCPHGCSYCYACGSDRAVSANRSRHDPQSSLLIGAPAPLDSFPILS